MPAIHPTAPQNHHVEVAWWRGVSRGMGVRFVARSIFGVRGHERPCRVAGFGTAWAQLLFGALTAFVVVTIALAASPAVTPAHAARPAKPAAAQFEKADDVLAWMNGYRREPRPERLADAVKAMSALGLTRDMEQAGIYIGFVAGVLGANPDKTDTLIPAMFPLSPHDQVLLIRAIAYSGLIEWKDVLLRYVERMPARKVLIDRFVFGGKPTLETLDIASEDQPAIDLNWGYYFATGAEAPLRRIVGALALMADRNKIDKITIGAMAQWTLAQNAARDAELLAALKQISSDQTGPARPPLNEAIEAAETLELAKIKRNATAAIDEVRTKGPERVRNYNWWSQAGQTVLALGCVAAGALGQVEFGIPCVVGGALSTAALKYLTPTE